MPCRKTRRDPEPRCPGVSQRGVASRRPCGEPALSLSRGAVGQVPGRAASSRRSDRSEDRRSRPLLPRAWGRKAVAPVMRRRRSLERSLLLVCHC